MNVSGRLCALGAVSSNPFDLVKTRMQVPAAMSEYTSMKQCMMAIAKKEGFGTFYNGVGASVMRDMLGKDGGRGGQTRLCTGYSMIKQSQINERVR